MIKNILCLLFALLLSMPASGAIDLTSASDTWSSVLVGDNFDQGQDTQAAAAVDLTGFGTMPLFFMKYDDAGTTSDSSDDEVAFRFRADNAVDNQGKFSGYIWIALDVDTDNDIDAFMMLVGKNGAYKLDVYDAGTGANVSPSTTDINSSSISPVLTGFTFHHDLVNSIDATGNPDMDNDSDPDYLISYKVNFDALANALNLQSLTGSNPVAPISSLNSGSGITLQTTFRVAAASAQNANTLNGDIGGYDDKIDDLAETYASRGAFSGSLSFSNPDPVVTPSATTSTISASPASIAADGSSTTTITVQLKDAAGNDLTTGGDTVVLSTNLGSLGSVTDNGNGRYSATLTSGTTPGTATISGTLNAVAMSNIASVDFFLNSDHDGDLIPDDTDLDDDNDGIPDSLEGDGTVDTDLDGVPDSLDLDADNDGLYDLDESGAAMPGLDLDADGRIDAVNPVGSNGLTNAVETTADSGVINYTIADSDADSVPDFQDRDSDNDGMFDTIEADGSDADNDGVIGTGNPTVDSNGLATLSGLPVIDTDNDLVPDYRDLDSDNDGLYDVVESAGSDADNDGVPGNGIPLIDAFGVAAGTGLIPFDTDGDSVLDYRDRDSDNDGLTDFVETGGSDPDGDGIPGTGSPVVNSQGVPAGGGLVPTDTDNDGSIDSLDLDSDADGIFDLVEAGGTDLDNNGIVDGFTDINGDGYDDGLTITPLTPQDTDGDGIPDYRDNDDIDNDGVSDNIDADDDNDAIPDALEGDAAVDTDADGIPDSRDLDSDNDGLSDLAESGANYMLLDANNDGQVDNTIPLGANGLADSVETLPDSGLIAYNGGTVLDTDADGVADFRDRDSDNDGIFDVVESGGSDPDMDGVFGDGIPAVNPKGIAGTTAAVDTDGDGIPNQRDGDSDNDGIPDTVEAGVDDPDLDGLAGSGMPDIDSNGTLSGNGVNPPDSDNDGIPDQLDLDSDNDGIFDLVEAGGVDVDNNGQVDRFIDVNGDGLDDILAANPLPNLLPDLDVIETGTDPVIIETGLNGAAGCTIRRAASVDPALPLLVAGALLCLWSRRATRPWNKD